MIEKESEEDDVPSPTCAKPTLQFHPRAAIAAHYTPIMEIIMTALKEEQIVVYCSSEIRGCHPEKLLRAA
jgi:hypothetical protein